MKPDSIVKLYLLSVLCILGFATSIILNYKPLAEQFENKDALAFLSCMGGVGCLILVVTRPEDSSMSYNCSFDLQVWPVTEFRSVWEWYEENCHTFPFGEEPVTWRDQETDTEKASKAFPTTLIYISVEGEEQGDLYAFAYLEGKKVWEWRSEDIGIPNPPDDIINQAIAN